MSSIFVQNFSSIDDDEKKLSFSQETDFKAEAETLDIWISQYISKWHEICFTYIVIYNL